LYKLGRVLHLGSGQNLILKGERKPKIGDKVVDDKGRYVGIISDVFGPTASPYISVKTNFRKPKELINRTLYAYPFKKRGRR